MLIHVIFLTRPYHNIMIIVNSEKRNRQYEEKGTRCVNTNALVSNITLLMGKWLFEDAI